MREKGSWSAGLRKKADYPTTPLKLAARHLRLLAGRFLADTASEVELDEAIAIWQAERAGDEAVPRACILAEVIYPTYGEAAQEAARVETEHPDQLARVFTDVRGKYCVLAVMRGATPYNTR